MPTVASNRQLGVTNLNIGQTIRTLRHQRNMTAVELGRRAGLSQPRISKIETGVDSHPKLADIEAMLHILDAPQIIQQQVVRSFDRKQPLLLRRRSARYAYGEDFENESKASFIRTFCLNVIPALLQTIEFREALLKHNELNPDIRAAAMSIALKRQELLWSRRNYHFIIHELALYTMPGDKRTQTRQLDRVKLFLDSKHCKVGIMPLQCGLLPGPENGTFTIYDDRRVAIALADKTLETQDKADIAEHLAIFTGLDRMSDYDDSASGIIDRAIDYYN
jgi:transcriptional regulator with XRE-family HTH domain